MIVTLDVTSPQGRIHWLHDSQQGDVDLSGSKYAETLAPAVQDLCKQRGKNPSRLGVVTGPGSFTGIRIGLSFAMGWHAAGGSLLYGADLFTLAANYIQQHQLDHQRIVIPSGKRFVFCRQKTNGQWDAPYQSQQKDIHSCDNWISLYPMPGIPTFEADLLAHFAEQIAQQNWGPVEQPEPLYIRPPDAKRMIPISQQAEVSN